MHMEIASRGVAEWNAWRLANLRVQPDLTRIDLSGRDLRGIDLRGVGLFKADLSKADLRSANLRQSIMIKTNLCGADLSGSHVYGASVWDVGLDDETVQRDLVITEPGESTVTVDNLEMAQFIRLLLSNKKIRDVIDTITSKVVLILGRFTPDRKVVLDAIKTAARKCNLLPVLFDFDGPKSRDITETVRTLALLSKFIVVDLTSPASVPQELQAVVPYVNVPVAPLIQTGERPYSMFGDFRKYQWVLEITEYRDVDEIAEVAFPEILRKVSATPRR